MEKKETKKVYERCYDSPTREDGSKKPNKYLGEFVIDKTIFEDTYNGEWVGHKENNEVKKYLIKEIEVSDYGFSGNGGTRFEVIEI